MNLVDLPKDLPVPEDDGACSHLLGMSLPGLEMATHKGEMVNLNSFDQLLVLYFYPMTARPGLAIPDGWDQIPGARGCTPQSCSFRDHYKELQALNAQVFGVSTQHSDYQDEAVNRLHLPFDLLSDAKLELAKVLKLPTFEVEGKTLIKRITLIAKAGKIEKVFYPVFPPDENADNVIAWLSENQF